MNGDSSPPEVSHLRNTRILTLPYIPLRPTKVSSKLSTTPHINRIRTIKTEIGPQFSSLNLPRRLFKWIYSVSLVILVSLLLAFIAVTPIDVIVQTSSASSSGIKLFIVIIVCVVFLLLSFSLYFSRIYQHRVLMNDIPSKSVYIPEENDLPKKVYKHIDEKFKQCEDIKVKAGPLKDDSVNINHPGLSPPVYVQQRNKSDNLDYYLPPNLLYEDVIRSFGDKLNFHDGFTSGSSFDIPKQFTFRQIFTFLVKLLEEEGSITEEERPDLNTLMSLYERSKFGGQLLTASEMVKFVIECERAGSLLYHHYGYLFSYRKRRIKTSQAAQLAASSLKAYSNSELSNVNTRSEYGDQYDDFDPSQSDSASADYDYALPVFDDDESMDPVSHFGRRRSEFSQLSRPSGGYSSQSNFPGSSQFTSSANLQWPSHGPSSTYLPTFTRLRTSSRDGDDSGESDVSVLKRNASGSHLRRPGTRDSQQSIIKKKLSISDDLDQRKNSVTFDLGYSDPTRRTPQERDDNASIETPTKGTERPGRFVIPELHFEPSTPIQETFRDRSPSPTSVLGLEIKRSKSPKRK